MKRQSLYFIAPRRIEVSEELLPEGKPGQVLVQTIISAISPGTEMLIYRGLAPVNMAADMTISALGGNLDFPLKYGYASVGRVVDAKPQRTLTEPHTSPHPLLGRLVFVFSPHESHYWANPDDLLVLPANLSAEDAAFLPFVETAVNFLHDGQPLMGERVVVFGQGVLGLLTTALLQSLQPSALITLDRHLLRRQASLELGVQASLDPGSADDIKQLQSLLNDGAQPPGADLIFELSGAPEALDQAIAFAGFGGRIVIGSWYGRKRADIDLGGHFHRNRLRLISSQVSTIAPELSGRWTKARRLELALQVLTRLKPSQWITHRFSLNQAIEAYDLVDRHPDKMIQVIFTYS